MSASASSLRLRVGVALFTIVPVLMVPVETRATIGHLGQEAWAPHARFHLFMGLGALLAANGLVLLLAWGPLRRGERWAWLGIAFAAVALLGADLVGASVTGGLAAGQQGVVAGGPALLRGLIVAAVLYAVGLAVTWPGGVARGPSGGG